MRSTLATGNYNSSNLKCLADNYGQPEISGYKESCNGFRPPNDLHSGIAINETSGQ